jgi:ABC-type amino acid transport substrate-binding protein
VSALWLAAAAAGLTNAQSAKQSTTADPTLERIKRDGHNVIGHRTDAAPFSFVDDKGAPQGYSIDLCGQIAKAVGTSLQLPNLEVRYREITPANHLDLLNAGPVDIVCGATTMTFKRRERAAFTLLTFITGGAALLSQDSEVRSPSDFKGRKVGLRADTTTDMVVSAGVAKRGMNRPDQISHS